jgi:hypothetical protein
MLTPETQACPLTGIIFVIVIIRVGLRSHPDAYWSSARTQTTMVSGHAQPNASESHVLFVTTPVKRAGMNGVSITTDTTTYGDPDVEAPRLTEDVELGTLRPGDARYYGDKKGVPL